MCLRVSEVPTALISTITAENKFHWWDVTGHLSPESGCKEGQSSRQQVDFNISTIVTFSTRVHQTVSLRRSERQELEITCSFVLRPNVLRHLCNSGSNRCSVITSGVLGD